MAYLKNELSGKNPYWLSKHRYLELTHYCQQYKEWKNLYQKLAPRITIDSSEAHDGQKNIRAQEDISLIRAELKQNMDLIERVAADTDGYLGRYLFIAVTEGLSFPQLKMKYSIACGKNMYYDRYRKFFWRLSQEKGL